MPFYVRLGPRGFFFRAGTFLIGIFGSAVYWLRSRCRRSYPPPAQAGFFVPERTGGLIGAGRRAGRPCRLGACGEQSQGMDRIGPVGSAMRTV